MLRHTHILPSSGVDFDHTMFRALLKPWALRVAQEKVNSALAGKTEGPLPRSCYLFFCVCIHKKLILLYVCVEICRSCKTVHHRDQHCITVIGITQVIRKVSTVCAYLSRILETSLCTCAVTPSINWEATNAIWYGVWWQCDEWWHG